MDEIYLATSPSWEANKVNIKIGCSKDAKERKKAYDTHNPEIGFSQVFSTPSRAFSLAIEDSFLALIRRHRVSASEWYKVDRAFYDSFCQLTSLRETLAFCQFSEWLDTEISLLESRFKLEEITKQSYARTSSRLNKLIIEYEEVVRGD